MAVTAQKRTEKLDFRITQAAKIKLQAAAAAVQQPVSEFVLESALAKAEETLASRTTFGLDDAAWRAFQKVLNAPARELPRMKALISKQGFFEE